MVGYILIPTSDTLVVQGRNSISTPFCHTLAQLVHLLLLLNTPLLKYSPFHRFFIFCCVLTWNLLASIQFWYHRTSKGRNAHTWVAHSLLVCHRTIQLQNKTIWIYKLLIMIRNIAANLAQMAHPGVGFFYPDDRVVVVGYPSFIEGPMYFVSQLCLTGEPFVPCVCNEHNNHQPHGESILLIYKL